MSTISSCDADVCCADGTKQHKNDHNTAECCGIFPDARAFNIEKLSQLTMWLQCFDAVGWAAGRASGL